MNNKILLAVLIGLPGSLFASNFDMNELLRKPSPEERAKLLPEKSLQEYDMKLGVVDKNFKIENDKHEFSFSAELSHQFDEPLVAQSFQFEYFYKLHTIDDLWLSFQVSRVTGKFNALSDGQTTPSTNPEAESNLDRLEERQTLLTAGLGLSYRFKLLSKFNTSERFYERLSTSFGYATNTDEDLDYKYTGYAYQASYAFTYRNSAHFSYGGKFTYHIYELIRETSETPLETKHDREMNLGFLTIGFNVAYIF